MVGCQAFYVINITDKQVDLYGKIDYSNGMYEREMFSFKGFITKERNTHLEHLEDDIINKGSKGGRNAVNFLKSIRNMLAGSSSKKVNMTVKWDGAPAIICGIDPENGKFFVGTKAVFNKTPKVNYTNADIRKNHSGELANKLSIALKELSKLGISGVLQGDFLFSKSDLKTANIDGDSMITFTPNTITYAVPVNSSIGKRITRAKMGIVFHTSYSGKTLSSMTAGFGTVRGKSGISSVFLADAAYKDVSGSAKFTKSELSSFDALIRKAEGSLSKAAPILDEMSKSTSDQFSIGFRLKTFFNYYIRNSKGGMAKVRTLQEMFRNYYEAFVQQEIDARKTEAGKDKYRTILKNGLSFIDKNQNALVMAIASHVSLQTCKNSLVSKLSQIQSIGHFLRTPNGYKVTAPEGFVAVDKGNAVKLVDRLEFSRANFTAEKDWVKG
jgi:hypothetical protein|tara:strand:+ start:1928 stop:3250 length:1323 start_codon:yes stop_codon:yes gene_type:complete